MLEGQFQAFKTAKVEVSVLGGSKKDFAILLRERSALHLS